VVKKPVADKWVACPKCHWNCAYPTLERAGLDLLVKLLFLRPFRCRSCHKRHYRLSVYSSSQ
jgi:hypothetical protein